MVHHWGIGENPEKIQTLLDMKSQIKIKDVQHLIGCTAALNQFIARTTDHYLPFLKPLKKGSDFVWKNDCKQSFQLLKFYLRRVPLLSKPIKGEILSLYLAISETAISVVLFRKEES